MFYFARSINIIFNSLQLVKCDVRKACKIKFLHTIIYHILLLYALQRCEKHYQGIWETYGGQSYCKSSLDIYIE